MRDDSSNEIVYGIVARTQSAPSSSFGMNSAPMAGISASESAKSAVDAPTIARHGMLEGPRRARARSARASTRTPELRRSFTDPRRNHTQSTGSSVTVSRNEPASAKIVVSAIGWNSCPDGPASA